MQFIALVEEAVRGVDPGSGYLFLPVRGNLQPTFEPKDVPRKEFRGEGTGLGDMALTRTESAWNYALESAWYPGPEVGLLLKHGYGKAGTRATIDTTAKKGIIYPDVAPFGAGRSLGTKAVGIWCVYEKEGVTKKRYYGGGLVKPSTIKIEGTNDVIISFELVGAGDFIGEELDNDLVPVFPTVEPFVSSDVLLYIGSGISRTGTAPNFTDIEEGTMNPFVPDSFTITPNLGNDLKVVLDGVQGPNKPYRANQVSIEVSAPMDLADPSSGFSSADEADAIFVGPSTQSLLVKIVSSALAGSVDEPYSVVIDLPNMQRLHKTPQRNSDGSQPTIELSYKSLNDATAKYPIALMTVDQAPAY